MTRRAACCADRAAACRFGCAFGGSAACRFACAFGGSAACRFGGAAACRFGCAFGGAAACRFSCSAVRRSGRRGSDVSGPVAARIGGAPAAGAGVRRVQEQRLAQRVRARPHAGRGRRRDQVKGVAGDQRQGGGDRSAACQRSAPPGSRNGTGTERAAASLTASRTSAGGPPAPEAPGTTRAWTASRRRWAPVRITPGTLLPGSGATGPNCRTQAASAGPSERSSTGRPVPRSRSVWTKSRHSRPVPWRKDITAA